MDRQFAPTQEDILSSINEHLGDIKDLLVGIYIQQLRMYDMTAIVAEGTNEKLTDSLIESHTQGKVLCPEPALAQDE